MGLCNSLLYNARIGYENTYDMRDIFNKNKEIEHLKEKVRKKEERIKVLKKCLFKAKCTTNTKRRRKPKQ